MGGAIDRNAFEKFYERSLVVDEDSNEYQVWLGVMEDVVSLLYSADCKFEKPELSKLLYVMQYFGEEGNKYQRLYALLSENKIDLNEILKKVDYKKTLRKH